MAAAIGFGGVFLRASDPGALYAWYEQHLGVKAGEGGFTFEAENQRGPIAVSFFARSPTYFPVEQSAMLNFQVDDLETLLQSLQQAGANVDANREVCAYGRFGWFTDPEGNRVELWQPGAANGGESGAADLIE